jgi:hypothetical protein
MGSMTSRQLSIALLVFALPLAAEACARPVGAVRVEAALDTVRRNILAGQHATAK